ncbi:hypothetical protein [Embleya sp. NPDC001921]
MTEDVAACFDEKLAARTVHWMVITQPWKRERTSGPMEIGVVGIAPPDATEIRVSQKDARNPISVPARTTPTSNGVRFFAAIVARTDLENVSIEAFDAHGNRVGESAEASTLQAQFSTPPWCATPPESEAPHTTAPASPPDPQERLSALAGQPRCASMPWMGVDARITPPRTD